MSVLVVDDEEEIRLTLKIRLVKDGIDVIEAGTGLHALQILKAETPIDLILCDHSMPGGASGQTVLDFVRGHKKYKDIPFMMVTAHADKNRVVNAKKGGVTEYIVKPFNSTELLKKIRTLLGMDIIPDTPPTTDEKP